MPTFLHKFYRKYIKPVRSSAGNLINKMGRRKQCYICGRKFSHFLKYGNGFAGLSEFLRRVSFTGSNLDNFGCPYCHSTDRERHLFIYFDKLDFWKYIPDSTILHIAPEPHLAKKIMSLQPGKYIRGDLMPADEHELRIDITEATFEDNMFDVLICNHVLEHVANYRKAFAEIFRLIKPGGRAILQTPYSELLARNLEDDGINSDKSRDYFYGQRDHMRLFGRQQFLAELQATGFILQIIRSSEIIDNYKSQLFGINSEEDLFIFMKPEYLLNRD